VVFKPEQCDFCRRGRGRADGGGEGHCGGERGNVPDMEEGAGP
jgi:hypothetical protein